MLYIYIRWAMQLFEDRGRISGALMRTTSPWLAKSWTNGLPPGRASGGQLAQDPLRSIRKNARKVRNQLEWWWMDSSNFPKLVDYWSLLYNIYKYVYIYRYRLYYIYNDIYIYMYRVHIFMKYNALSWNIQILAKKPFEDQKCRQLGNPWLHPEEVLWRSQSFFLWKMIWAK